MTPRYLLDTNTVSAPISKAPNPEVLRRLEQDGAHCAIASVVWHELIYGISRLQPSRRRQALERYLEDVVHPSFPILAYDERAAAWHAAERSRLESKGLMPPFVDGQIAAIAATNGLILVTANSRDFRAFEGLELEDWSKKAKSR